MKIRLLLLSIGLTVLLALVVAPSPTSANASQGDDNAARQRNAFTLKLADQLSSTGAKRPAFDVNARVAIRLVNTNFYFTAVDGGGRTIDSIHADRTVAQGIDIWEVFTLEPQGDGVYAIKTANGANYLTANGGQHLGAVRTNATTVGVGEKFWLIIAGPL